MMNIQKINVVFISILLGFYSSFSFAQTGELVGEIEFPKSSIPITVAAKAKGTEAYLELTHDIRCGGIQSKGLPGIMGAITETPEGNSSGAEIRFDIFEGKERTLVALGAATSERTLYIRYEMQADAICKIRSLQTKIIYKNFSNLSEEMKKYSSLNDLKADRDLVKAIALKHAPVLAVRGDQYTNRTTDIPLEMVFNLVPDRKNPDYITIRYTVFFSDEDSKKELEELQGQMARYGRTTDIEWLYEITLNRNGEVIRESYQGGVFDKLSGNAEDISGDHSALTVESSLFLSSTNHRIFYNAALNNVFSDKPKDKEQKNKYVAYHLCAEYQVLSPRAREYFQMENATYMYLVSAKELERENKKINNLEDYLFVEVMGTLSPSNTTFNAFNGAFNLKYTIRSKDKVSNGESKKSIDRLGEDMFYTVSIPALVVGKENLDALLQNKATAEISFKEANFIDYSSLSITSTKLIYLEWNDSLSRYERKMIPMERYSLSKKIKQNDDFSSVIQLNLTKE